jgi:hypothetical protein
MSRMIMSVRIMSCLYKESILLKVYLFAKVYLCGDLLYEVLGWCNQLRDLILFVDS